MNENRPASWRRRSIVQGLGATAASANTQNARTRPVRIGIAGGRFGASFQWHLDPKAKVTAVCDIGPEALQRLSKAYDAATFDMSRVEAHPERGANSGTGQEDGSLLQQNKSRLLRRGKRLLRTIPG